MTITRRSTKGSKLTHTELDGNFEDLDSRVGFFDYNDDATSTTAISVTGGGGYVDLTNDALGTYTLKTYAPSGITDVWDDSTNKFDWSELSLGDMVDVRLDISVTTTGANQVVKIILEMATDGTPYDIVFDEVVFKTAGTYQIVRTNGVYMGNSSTLNDGAKFRISSDANATVVVNGWYCKVTRGAKI